MKLLLSVLLGLAIGGGIGSFDLLMWKEQNPVLFCQVVIDINAKTSDGQIPVLGYACADWTANDLRHFIKNVVVH